MNPHHLSRSNQTVKSAGQTFKILCMQCQLGKHRKAVEILKASQP